MTAKTKPLQKWPLSQTRYKFAGDADPDPLADGPCILKVNIDKAYTRATTAVEWENLANLAEYMESKSDSDIMDFYAYAFVKKQMETLASGGQITTDLVTHLFKE